MKPILTFNALVLLLFIIFNIIRYGCNKDPYTPLMGRLALVGASATFCSWILAAPAVLKHLRASDRATRIIVRIWACEAAAILCIIALLLFFIFPN
jgi:hypothetical protein